jgi:hypothetical protein
MAAFFATFPDQYYLSYKRKVLKWEGLPAIGDLFQRK